LKKLTKKNKKNVNQALLTKGVIFALLIFYRTFTKFTKHIIWGIQQTINIFMFNVGWLWWMG